MNKGAFGCDIGTNSISIQPFTTARNRLESILLDTCPMKSSWSWMTKVLILRLAAMGRELNQITRFSLGGKVV